jgi:hypothetical protein
MDSLPTTPPQAGSDADRQLAVLPPTVRKALSRMHALEAEEEQVAIRRIS